MEGKLGTAFLFGDAISQFETSLDRAGVHIHRTFEGCHPFTVVGEVNQSVVHFLEDCNSVPIITQIKKNFSNILARNAEIYESNYTMQNHPKGMSVDDCNYSDYLIVYFSSVDRKLYHIGQSIFAAYGKDNEFPFTKELKEENQIKWMLSPSFNWEYYLRLFADACLQNYDSDHIILIRTNPSDWIINKNQIQISKESSATIKACVRKIENAFLDFTHCHLIEIISSYIRSDKETSVWHTQEFVRERLAETVRGVLDGEKKEKHCPYSHPLIRRIFHRLNRDKQILLHVEFDKYDREIDSVIYRHFLENTSNEMLVALSRLTPFFEKDYYTLSDYIRDSTGKIDELILELYAEYFQLDINDVLSIFCLYSKTEMKEKLKKTIHNICVNQDCLPIESSHNFIRRNQKYLQKYKYLDESLRTALNFNLGDRQTTYFTHLSENVALCMQLAEEEQFFFMKWEESCADVDEIVDHDMICQIRELNLLSKNWRFYIQRAKKKKGNVPLVCVLNDVTEFIQSLVFLDYPKILESENAILALRENQSSVLKKYTEYKSICNFETLMDENARIFYINNGLSDQMNFYVFSKMMQEKSGVIPYYDDLRAREFNHFNGIEIDRVVKDNEEKLKARMLSNIISPQLKSVFGRELSFPDYCYENGWDDISCVVQREMRNWGGNVVPQKCMCLSVTVSKPEVWMTANNSFFKYYFWHAGTDGFCENVDQIKQWLELPEFDDEINCSIANDMLSSDAVVIHIRTGDYVSAYKKEINVEFYKKCLTKLLNIKEYKNKKFFVFGDDMNWIRSHTNELGLTLLNERDIYYIDHNKRENSIYDLKLMSLGKVFIFGLGMFGRKAAQFSNRKEIIVSMVPYVNRMWKNKGWKNRYELLE